MARVDQNYLPHRGQFRSSSCYHCVNITYTNKHPYNSSVPFRPLAVWYHDRKCTGAVCLNIILLFLFVLPAVIHALWYCLMREKS
uniref:LITAF domain-containing protein n=1 Tax=Heterorhabditis bacteriophora TaxID=37862 RepID=A0A1I7WTD3_HETBA